MKTPKIPSIRIKKSTTPGSYTMKARLLRTALGLNEDQDMTPLMVHGLQSHPNPDIAAAAKSFSFKGYKPVNPIKP